MASTFIPRRLIHRLEYLRGHEAAWTDPYEHPEELRRLLQRLSDIAIDAIDRFADMGVNGIMSCDDWGLQDRPMISPAMFAEFVRYGGGFYSKRLTGGAW